MTSAEFTEWQAYYAAEPFGDLRDDFRIGILDSLVANLVTGKSSKKAVPMDFVVFGEEAGQKTALDPKPKVYDKETRRASQKAQIAEMRILSERLKGK